MPPKTTQSDLLRKLDSLLEKLDQFLPRTDKELGGTKTFRWKSTVLGGVLLDTAPFECIQLDDLINISEQATLLESNTSCFASGKPANHALLTGPRGCGKSSLVRAVLQKHASPKLRVIQVDRSGIATISELAEQIAQLPGKFIVLCDDLSFDKNNEEFHKAKSSLDSCLGKTSNFLIYATSNKRHLVSELMAENLAVSYSETGEIHPEETTEEKMSFSDRFGLWIPFFQPNHDEYLSIVSHWFKKLNVQEKKSTQKEALEWAQLRGSMNGRIAKHFAVYKLCCHKPND